MNAQLTAQEKLDRGLPLTADDIRELMKDPNSWVYKLYQEVLMMSAAISEAIFICYVESAIRAMQDARSKDAALERAMIREQEKHQQLLQQEPLAAKAQLLQQKMDLQNELGQLLRVPQANMNIVQLTNHHQKLMTNLNNQLLNQLGSTLMMPQSGLKLNVPTTVAPIASLDKILSVNPVLAKQVIADEITQKSFINFHTLAETGHLAVLKMFSALMEFNGVTDIGVKDKIEVMKFLGNRQQFLNDHNDLLIDHLKTGNGLMLKLVGQGMAPNKDPIQSGPSSAP